LIIPELVSNEGIEQYRKRFKELCENAEERPISMTVLRDVELVQKGVSADSEQVVTKIQDFQDDSILFEYCKDPAILKYVEAWTGPRIVASHTMVINKPTDPGRGSSRHPLHQDLLYFPFRPAEKIVASWTAMENVTRENGCLIAVPGSHRTELLEHGYPDWAAANSAYVGIMGVTSEVKYVHLPMNKGDTIFFHPLLWHGSGRNLTPNFRKAISCHFASGDCRFINVQGTIQHELEDELKGLLKIKLDRLKVEYSPEMMQQFKLKEIWEVKSRIIQGNEMIQPMQEEDEQ
jgi:phytanoyl-CoA hydroxylase